MRISTSMIFNNGTNGIQARQFDLYKVQQQLSTGKRILTPADDPIGASEALKVSQSKGVNKQFLDNQADAKTRLNYLEDVLANMGDELTSAFEKASLAGNTTYSASNRGMIATELASRMQSLLGLANTQDGTGLYIFAGFQSTTKPFELNTGATQPYALGAGTYVTYNGDAGQQSLQVTSSNEMEVSENGLDVFMQVKDASGNVKGRSLFDSLQNMIDILNPASGVPYTVAAYTQALGDLSDVVTHFANVRGSVGARLNSLDSMTSMGEDVGYQYDTRLSQLQDLDYTEAISRFSNYQMQLEAAQLSFKQTSQLSLFNIL
ncbi:MAG: Flagellin, N-terminal [Proteobacteria bacterium]|nr:Flagellin, N-terminal [Pseudomonadota bacterium]